MIWYGFGPVGTGTVDCGVRTVVVDVRVTLRSSRIFCVFGCENSPLFLVVLQVFIGLDGT